jgi:hypothetical protein
MNTDALTLLDLGECYCCSFTHTYSYLGKCVGIGPVAYEPSGHLRGVEHLLIHQLKHKQASLIMPSAHLGCTFRRYGICSNS